MRSTTIVFRGVEQVVDAYEANDIPAWAIVNGNDILCADAPESTEEGRKMLEEMLKRLCKGNSRAAFDLRVYKCKPGTDIEPSMKPHRAFRFSLYEDGEFTPYEAGRKRALEAGEGQMAELRAEIEELKKALAEKEEEAVEDPQEGINKTIAGISAFFETPLGQLFKPRIAGILQKVWPVGEPPQQRPAQVAGITQQLDRMSQTQPDDMATQQAGPGGSLLDAEQLAKAQAAISVLCTKDAQLGDHLEKIARIAVENPGQYKLLVGMLK